MTARRKFLGMALKSVGAGATVAAMPALAGPVVIDVNEPVHLGHDGIQPDDELEWSMEFHADDLCNWRITGELTGPQADYLKTFIECEELWVTRLQVKHYLGKRLLNVTVEGEGDDHFKSVMRVFRAAQDPSAGSELFRPEANAEDLAQWHSRCKVLAYRGEELRWSPRESGVWR